MREKKHTALLLAVLMIMLVLTPCIPDASADAFVPLNVEAAEEEDARLEEYADLLIRKGLNLQKGQKLIVKCPVENYDFAHLCMKKAYEAGAADVNVLWIDNEGSRLRFLNADDGVFDTCPATITEFYAEAVRDKAARLILTTEVPGLLDGVDLSRVSRYSEAAGMANGEYLGVYGSFQLPWCGAAVPSLEWAKKLFPDLSEEEAMDALWDRIFQTVYVQGDGAAIERWDQHLEELSDRCEKMNSFKFKTLHYTNSAGTDFTVNLPDNHRWMGGDIAAENGEQFCPNMPTEEIFSAPDKGSGNGVLCATLPLVLDSVEVRDLKLTLKDGKIVDVEATSGKEMVEEALKTDEGARYLGEIALVPYDSPISKQKMLYYSTLFDENAACHFAFGSAYPECIQGGENMSEEELEENGINTSYTHVDFMVGSSDLRITGTTVDGEEVLIFENGVFTPEILEGLKEAA